MGKSHSKKSKKPIGHSSKGSCHKKVYMKLDLIELRRRLVIAMGSRCADCKRYLDPSELIINHKGFERGEKLGGGSPIRRRELYEWKRTGEIPKETELLCKRCHRKYHGYRPSNRDIFGDRMRRSGRKEMFKGLLTPEERQRLDEDMARYLRAYPFLAEPVTFDLLEVALFIRNVFIPRLYAVVLDPGMEVPSMLSAQKRLETLQRTLVLLFTRMGIGYTTRPRRKYPSKIKAPLELEREGFTEEVE